MKRKRKRSSLTAPLLAAAMILSVTLAACDDTDGGKKDESAENTENGRGGETGEDGGELGSVSENQSETPSVTRTPVEIPDDYTVYQNGEYDFSVAVPKSWESAQTDGHAEASWIDAEYSTDETPAVINLLAGWSGGVTQADFPDGEFQTQRKQDLEEAYAGMYDNFESGGLECAELGNNIFLIYSFSCTEKDSGVSLNIGHSMTVVDGNMVSFMFIYPEETVEGNEADIDAAREKILTTFMIL